MSELHGGYVSAGNNCSAGATTGAKALMSWILAIAGSTNLGIFACRNIADTDILSVHGEGRALDVGWYPYNRQAPAWAWNLANWLRAHSKELGVQCIILEDKIWSSNRWQDGWRPYSGAWHDHMHVELTPSAAASLTVARINAVAGAPPVATPDWTEKAIMALPEIRNGADGIDVRRAQGLLAANGHPPARSFDGAGRPDGNFGTHTTVAVKGFQRARDLQVDGIIGRHTWTELLGQG